MNKEISGIINKRKQPNKKRNVGEFPGGPEVRTVRFQCCGPSSIPGWGTTILQAAQPDQKKKKKKVGMSEVQSQGETKK